MKKNILIGIGALVAVLVLAGAAFLAARLLFPAAQGANGLKGGPNLVTKGFGGGSAPVQQSVRLDIVNAQEIPTRTADLTGMITGIKDNSFTISVGGEMSVSIDDNGETHADVDPNATATEIVVTKETQMYLDTTFANRTPEEGLPGDGEKVQQTVESITLSDLEKNNMVMVWGYKRGDRLIAETILYTKPVIFRAPGN